MEDYQFEQALLMQESMLSKIAKHNFTLQNWQTASAKTYRQKNYNACFDSLIKMQALNDLQIDLLNQFSSHFLALWTDSNRDFAWNHRHLLETRYYDFVNYQKQSVLITRQLAQMLPAVKKLKA